jgi:hypothetical protein
MTNSIINTTTTFKENLSKPTCTDQETTQATTRVGTDVPTMDMRVPGRTLQRGEEAKKMNSDNLPIQRS